MAFNPFASFRKYQKFWMTTLVFLAMFTFILCAGSGQGGLEDIVSRWLGRRAGAVLAKVNGQDLHSEELNQIKMQRQVANDFMRKFCDYLVKKTEDLLKRQDDKSTDPKALAKRNQTLQMLQALRFEFTERLKKPRYFEGSITLEGLADFKMWLAEADRLRIYLDAEAVRRLVESELNRTNEPLFDVMESRQVMFETRRAHPSANDQYILQAVRDEYRVRLARLAMLECQPGQFSPDRFHMLQDTPHEWKYKEGRVAVTPHQLWDFYKEKRAEFDLTLIPIEVSRFFKDLESPPQTELDSLFREYRKHRYDPTSDKPGFEIPQQIKVAWVTADPQSEAYQRGAKVLAALQTLSPGIAISTGSPLQNALAYTAVSTAERAGFDLIYQEASRRLPTFSVPLTSDGYLGAIMDYQAREHPHAVLNLIAHLAIPHGELTVPAALRHVMLKYHAEQYDRLARGEAKKRFPIYATIVGQAAQGQLPVISEWYAASELPQNLPLDVVLPVFHRNYEKSLAHKMVATTMLALRKALETPRIQGNEKGVERVLDELKKQYTFDYFNAKDFFNRYTVDQTKDLKPLRDSYDKYHHQLNIIEGRAGTERYLKEADFARLFFDKSEAFSIAQGKFNVKAWPPQADANRMSITTDPSRFKDVDDRFREQMSALLESRFRNPGQSSPVIDLYVQAEKPFLLWKSDEKNSAFPDKLDEVRGRVEEAWRTQQAREKYALPLAKKIAEALGQPLTDVSLITRTRDAADALKVAPIILERIAPLYLNPDGRYTAYQLPRDTFLYPRPDMVKQVLSFSDPQKAVQLEGSEHKELDRINQALFDSYKAGLDKNKRATRPLVQVLTNQPRTQFYVAVATRDPYADIRAFEFAYRTTDGAGQFQFQRRDEFLRIAYNDLVKQESQEVLKGIRERYHWWVTEVADERKGFDSDSPSD